MKRILVAMLAANALAACHTDPANTLNGSDVASLAATPVASSQEIEGHWSIVSFEDYRPERMQGTTPAAFATFTDNGVALRIECNYSGADGYVRDGRWVSVPGDRIMTLMGCGQEREDRDSRLFAFFDRNPDAALLSNGQLRFVAGETVLVLERPERRRLDYLVPAAQIDGKWRMDFLTRYEPMGGYSGIGLQDLPGRLVIDAGRAYYNRCPQYAVTFNYSQDGRLVKTAGTLPDKPVCPGLTTTAEYGELPRAIEILDLLHSDPWLEDVGDGAVILSNDRLAIQMTQQPCEEMQQSDDHKTTTIMDCASPE